MLITQIAEGLMEAVSRRKWSCSQPGPQHSHVNVGNVSSLHINFLRRGWEGEEGGGGGKRKMKARKKTEMIRWKSLVTDNNSGNSISGSSSSSRSIHTLSYPVQNKSRCSRARAVTATTAVVTATATTAIVTATATATAAVVTATAAVAAKAHRHTDTV